MFEILLILTMNSYNYGSAIEVIQTSSVQECNTIGKQWIHQDINTGNNKNMSYVCVQRRKND